MTKDNDKSILEGNNLLVELTPFLTHILPLIRKLPKWEGVSLNDTINQLLEQVCIVQHPSLYLYRDRYKELTSRNGNIVLKTKKKKETE